MSNLEGKKTTTEQTQTYRLGARRLERLRKEAIIDLKLILILRMSTGWGNFHFLFNAKAIANRPYALWRYNVVKTLAR